MSTVMLDALRLAAAGTPSFPCRADKRPACPHGFKDATADADALSQLWLQYPGDLIGVPTGEVSGLFVIDLDTAKHSESDEWLERHAPYLPETRQHRTRSGGLHLLFKHQAGLRNSTSKLAPGVDTRGDGGYIVWWAAHLGADHRLGWPIADLPEWIVEALAPPPAQLVPEVCRTIRQTVGRAGAPGMIRVQSIVAAVATAPEGQRNSLTFWGATKIRNMLADRVLDATEGSQALAALFHAGQRAGLSHAEVTKALSNGRNAPR